MGITPTLCRHRLSTVAVHLVAIPLFFSVDYVLYFLLTSNFKCISDPFALTDTYFESVQCEAGC